MHRRLDEFVGTDGAFALRPPDLVFQEAASTLRSPAGDNPVWWPSSECVGDLEKVERRSGPAAMKGTDTGRHPAKERGRGLRSSAGAMVAPADVTTALDTSDDVRVARSSRIRP